MLDHVLVLAAREAHALLAHAVRTREVELEAVAAALLRHLRQLDPVVLVVAAHDRRDHNAVREVLLQLKKRTFRGNNT